MYYKLRGVQGINGGRFSEASHQPQLSLQESFESRVVGSRFQEVDRTSSAFVRPPLGSDVSSPAAAPADPPLYGPNNEQLDEHGFWRSSSHSGQNGNGDHALDDEWVDVSQEAPIDFASIDPMSVPTPVQRSSFVARMRSRMTETPSDRRETFPRRADSGEGSRSVERPPPHLRLQLQQPFVRPVHGLNHDNLGSVYSEIREWRSKLKLINAEIAKLQEDCYNEIADGTRIKGWIIVGRGLRFIPGIQLIEGRAKEDIRWDVLQHERTPLDTIVLWLIVGIVILLLAVGCEHDWSVSSSTPRINGLRQ
jgi:hypothetical protein